MDYTIQIDEASKIVAATASGDWTSDTDNTMVNEIMAAVADRESCKVLLDMRELRFDLSILHIFERAREMRELRQKVNRVSSKVALIYSPTSEKLEQDMRFFETAAQNRALPYRTFTDIEEAKTWLLAD